MLGQGTRVDGVLRAAVDGDREARRPRLDEELRRAPALVDGQQHALTGRSEGKQAVQAARREERNERGEHGFVQPGPAVCQRRHRGGQRSPEHAGNCTARHFVNLIDH